MSGAALYEEVLARGGLVDLSGRTRFHLRGADRIRYLNGQISNNVRDLQPAEARSACVLTAKGKMCALIFYSAAEDFLRIDAPASQREELAARLERYMIADDVELDDVADTEALFHLLGSAAEHLGADPRIIHRARVRRFGMEGWDLYVEGRYREEVLEVLSAEVPGVGDELLETIRIERGVPVWGAELDENTIPVEAGLQESAIDYAKGCYIGQEVISRLKSIGHVNRQLRGLVALGGTGLARGMTLVDPANPEKTAGVVTSAAHSFALARPVALGYVKRGVAAGILHALRPNNAGRPEPVEVEVRPLPLIP